MKKVIRHRFKRILAVLLIVVMAGTMLPDAMVTAKGQEDIFPYTIFAASGKEGAVTVNAQNFCVNGNIATNGTVVSSGNMNLNGTKTEYSGENMAFVFDKVDSAYFKKDSVREHAGDYISNETNINLNVPTAVDGKTELNGNVNSVPALKSSGDIHICGNVLNANNSVICSEYGGIIIESDNVNVTGLLYAPFGSISIKSQSLNLNSTIIIAQEIVIDCPNVNINYNHDMGKLIGTSSELADIPSDEWENMEDENENGLPDYYEDYDNWASMADSDGDGLPDIIEDFIKTDRNLADSDGDGLDDFYEVFGTYTDPLSCDTDKNGISDADEDFDEDGLTNRQERESGTEPYNADTDEDGLKDGEEVNTYKTDPLKNDTDDDRLEDGDEIFFGTDPLNPDSDGNGILDGDEKRPQSLVYENGDSVIENVSISLEATGNIQRTSEIDNIMGVDILCSEVVGLVGEPFSIETDSKFDKAVISFKVDKSKLGDTEFADLLFLWYDEENYEYVELETICDEENSTVSVETTHFSKYMIVDSKKWFDAWAAKLNYSPNIPGVSEKTVYNTVLAIDCSGSMKTYDPVKSISVHGISQKSCKRIEAAEGFIDRMNEGDKAAVVLFELRASIKVGMTGKKGELKSALQNIYSDGGTNFDNAITQSINAFGAGDIGAANVKNRIILLSDGDANVSKRCLDMASAKKIKIYTVGLGPDSYDQRLKYISESTGGKFYKAFTGNELVDIYAEIGFGGDFDTTDTDGDGLYDVVETVGIRIQNGQIIKGCDPKKKDTDGDGLDDGKEIDPKPCYYLEEKRKGNEIIHVKGYSFKMKSNPTKEDSDGDGLLDGKCQYYSCRIIAPKDPTPLSYTGEHGLWEKHISVLNDENNNNFSKDYSDDYFGIEKKDGKLTVTDKESELITNWDDCLRASLTRIGSLTLSFTYDKEHIALHSDKKQWQVNFGYNDLYDRVAKKVAGINRMKLDFELDGKPYIVWAWKGNYLNLGPGAELGFYRQNVALKLIGSVTKRNHWIVGKERFPMTLSLYKKSFDSEGNVTGYSNYFNWMPGNKQWWSTGFVPNIHNFDSIKEYELIQISSVDFDDNPKMLEELKKKWENSSKYGKNLAFDMEDHKLWIMW